MIFNTKLLISSFIICLCIHVFCCFAKKNNDFSGQLLVIFPGEICLKMILTATYLLFLRLIYPYINKAGWNIYDRWEDFYFQVVKFLLWTNFPAWLVDWFIGVQRQVWQYFSYIMAWFIGMWIDVCIPILLPFYSMFLSGTFQ